MQNLKFLFIIVAFASLLVTFKPSSAQSEEHFSKPRAGHQKGEMPPPPPPPPGAFNPRVLEQLNLSDEQKEQIHRTLENAHQTAEQFHEQMRAVHEQLKTIVESANFNEAQARQLLAKKAQAETELDIIRLRTDNAIFNLLTVDQKARFEQIKRERPEPLRRPEIRP